MVVYGVADYMKLGINVVYRNKRSRIYDIFTRNQWSHSQHYRPVKSAGQNSSLPARKKIGVDNFVSILDEIRFKL